MNRKETLRRAESLLRQGRPDAAAQEYARVAEANPGDLATANALGDLYVRQQRPDLAIPLYLRVADIYLREGFFAKAAAFYKKVLKYQPRSDSVLVRLAEACRAQGLRVEARGYLQTALQARKRGSDPGAVDEILVRLADDEPSDLEAAIAAAPARARREGANAIPPLRATVTALEAAGRAADAEPVRRLIAILEPRVKGGADGAAPSTGSAMGGHAPSLPKEGHARSPLDRPWGDPELAEGSCPTDGPVPTTPTGGEPAATPSEPRAEADAHRAIDAAFARLRKAAPATGKDATSRLALAETYLAAGLDADAVSLLEALAADEATSDRAAFLMAGVCERQGRVTDAARWMAAALETGLRDPRARVDALQRLGDLYERLREPARALDAWREARDLAPDSGALDERIARLSSASGRGGGPFTR